MIPNGEGCHYLAVKKISELLKGIKSKHVTGFYCLTCFHSFRTKNKFESHKKVHENKYFCVVLMPSEDTKILELNQYQKSGKTPCIIYADLKSLIKKWIDVTIILKNHLQQKYVNIFHQVFQWIQYCHSKEQKASMMYTEVKIAWKSFLNALKSTQGG